VQSNAYGWGGKDLVYAVETGTGAIEYVPEDQLSSTEPTPPSEEEIPWAMVAAGIVVIVVVIAIAGYWIKK
jgi:hypothetical protein